MDEPKVIYKYNGPLNKYREYSKVQKRNRRQNSPNYRLYKRNLKENISC